MSLNEFVIPLPIRPKESKDNSVYIRPQWSAKPFEFKRDVSLEVMKGGVIIDNIDLSQRDYFIIGRQEDKLVDLLFEHPSISRHHAVIQNEISGKLFVYDLGSTWGTYVNMKKVDPHKFVEVKSGELLKFGESTRTYIVQLEEDESDENEAQAENEIESHKQMKLSKDTISDKQMTIQQKMTLIANQDKYRQKMKKNQINQLRNGRSSWGMTLDQDDQIRQFQQEQDEEDSKTLLSEQDLHLLDVEKIIGLDKLNLTQKQKAQLQKLDQMRRNLVKMHDKKSNAEKQADFEFDESKIAGQIKGLDGKAKNLKDAISREEEKIRNMLQQKIENSEEKDAPETKSKKLVDSDGEFDEFYDRTRQNEESTKASNKILSYEDLKNNIEALQQKRQDLSKEFNNFEIPQNNGDSEIDELDQFMMENSQSMKIDQRKKIAQEMVELSNEIERHKRMINMVKPSLDLGRAQRPAIVKQENAGDKIPKDATQAGSVAAPQSSIAAALQRLNDKNLLAQDQPNPEQERMRDHEEQGKAEAQMLVKSSQLQRDIQNIDKDQDRADETPLPDKSGLKNYFNEIISNAKAKDDNEGPRMDNYQEFTKSYEQQNIGKKRQSNEEQENDQNKRQRTDSEIDDWKAPQGQSGDGKTCLNDKFGY